MNFNVDDEVIYINDGEVGIIKEIDEYRVHVIYPTGFYSNHYFPEVLGIRKVTKLDKALK